MARRLLPNVTNRRCQTQNISEIFSFTLQKTLLLHGRPTGLKVSPILMSSSLSAGLRRLPDSVTSAVAEGRGAQAHASSPSAAQEDAAKDAVFAALAQPPSAATAEGTSSDSNPWWLWYEEA